jgi:hypothetical protein
MEPVEVQCFHVGRPAGQLCEVCHDTGVRRSARESYLWPMRAAIAGFGGAAGRPGRPGLTITLTTLARARGDIAEAAGVLARRWPAMGDPETARAHVAFALHRLRTVWPKYDTQAAA